MSFLEKVRELNKHPGLRRRARRVDFITDCWPELLAVVEAAQRSRRAMFVIDGEDSIRSLLNALDALDKKAGEG